MFHSGVKDARRDGCTYKERKARYRKFSICAATTISPRLNHISQYNEHVNDTGVAQKESHGLVSIEFDIHEATVYQEKKAELILMQKGSYQTLFK